MCGRFLLAAISLSLFSAQGAAETEAPFALISDTALCQTLSPATLSAAQGAVNRAPAATAHVHTEGTLPHTGIHDQSVQARRDWPAVLQLSLAYRATGQVADLHAAQSVLRAWFSVYQLSFDPIDETGLDQLILSLDVLRGQLDPGLQTQAHHFLQRLADGYLVPRDGKKGTDTNNWQSHRVKLGTLAAFALGDAALMDLARAAFLKQLSVNVQPDGQSIDFGQRDALHYQTYDLEPLLTAALAARAHGQDWFGLNENGLGRALEFLEPYARGLKTHEEFVHSTVKFDAERAWAGVAGFSGAWQPQEAALTYQLAARLDPRWNPLADALGRAPDWLAVGPLGKLGCGPP